MCLAQGHNTVMPVRLEPAAPQSRVKHSTTEPLRSLIHICVLFQKNITDFYFYFAFIPGNLFPCCTEVHCNSHLVHCFQKYIRFFSILPLFPWNKCFHSFIRYRKPLGEPQKRKTETVQGHFFSQFIFEIISKSNWLT